MISCNNIKIEQMLFAYETGVLNESEISELEQHLMDCDSCFQKAQQFEKAALLLKHDRDVRETLVSTTPSSSKPQKHVFKLAPVVLAAAVVLIVLILQPWRVEINPNLAAYADENRLAVLFFDNLADESDSLKTADIATNLLITDLSQTQYFQVMSSQRISDAMVSLGFGEKTKVEKSEALAIAREAKARWALSGTILQQKPELIITTQLIDVGTGRVFASHKEIAEPSENIFSVIDRVSTAIKDEMLDTKSKGIDPDRPVQELTTHSLEAYRYFLAGKESRNKVYFIEAVENFSKALELDSTIAMAYYYLTFHLPFENLPDMLDRAIAYSENLSDIEKRLITARGYELKNDYLRAIEQYLIIVKKYPDNKDALLRLAANENNAGQYDLALLHLDDVLALDRSNKSAYNLIVYCNLYLERLDLALEWADKYINLVPDEANPYDTKAEILLTMGMSDSAIIYLNKALEIKPDYAQIHDRLSAIYLQKGMYEKSEFHFKAVLGERRGRYLRNAVLYPALISIKQGHYKTALRELDSLKEVYNNQQESRHNNAILASILFLKARVYDEQGEFRLALTNLRNFAQTLKYPVGLAFGKHQLYYWQILALSGMHEQFDKEIGVFQKFGTFLFDGSIGEYYLEGIKSYYLKDYDDAVINLRKSLGGDGDFFTNYMLGRVYLDANKPDSAIQALEAIGWCVDNRVYFNDIWDVKYFFLLGQAYEKNGDTQLALKNYEKFLEFYKNGDREIDEIEKAKIALNRLKDTL